MIGCFYRLSEPMRKTKIVCTIGPACWERDQLRRLIDAGMDVARLNFSHVTPDQYPRYEELIRTIRELAVESGKEIMVLHDLGGLKIRIGKIEGERKLRKGERVMLVHGEEAKGDEIPIKYEHIVTDAKNNERILFNDGKVALRVVEKHADRLVAEVLNDGSIVSYKGVNLPDTAVSAPKLTEKDKRDIVFGIANDVDWFAISFVRTVDDVAEAQEYVKGQGGVQKVMVKVERPEAVRDIEQITKVADGIMVARGDLGVEVPYSEVPVMQKKMVSVAAVYGKPVLVATQMLYGMIHSPFPTRAEVSDVANAVHDRADAVMLSEETAMGEYPVEAVQVMGNTIDAMERSMSTCEGDTCLPDREYSPRLRSAKDMETTVLAYHALRMAEDAHAAFIAVITRRGYSALQVARFRPEIPVIAYVPALRVQRELGLVYGMNEMRVADFSKDMMDMVAADIRSRKGLKAGDKIIIVSIGKDDSGAQLDDVRLVTYK